MVGARGPGGGRRAARAPGGRGRPRRGSRRLRHRRHPARACPLPRLADRPPAPVEAARRLRDAQQRHRLHRRRGARGHRVRYGEFVGADLHGRRLGLLGLGKIGSRVARVGLAFGMRVSAWSQNLTKERAEEAGVELAAGKEDLLATSDFVSVHLALGERTRGLLGAAELALMKPTAYLVNTSRAAIVDQDALLAALREGRIAGAGIDVFDVEPLPASHPMRTAPRLLATPHLGYVSRANYATYYGQAVEDIQAYLEGSPVRRLP
ncbi:NAD(P)-dependent oxidoreductase [Streptomyces sp. SAS_269]|uniref:NAD(P)-dependent oxidoreductase n=1 Tax=Streptomyces sp. SAS_269 TaxID=3412749 RepID=UPI00403D0B1D